MTENKLIFVYNANSGLHNAILDSAHKIISPDTYACNLCDVTYGAIREDSVWRKYRKKNKKLSKAYDPNAIEMEFLHKNEFVKKYDSKEGDTYTYPIVLAVKNNYMEVFIHTEIMDVVETSEELIELIEARRNKFFNN